MRLPVPLLLLLCLAGSFFASCTVPGGSPVASGPVALHQPTLAARWSVQEDGDGVRYVDPKSSLTFLYIRKVGGPGPAMAAPPLIQPMYSGETAAPPPGTPQPWKHTQILGQPVRWYQEDMGSGADFPAFATEVFPVTTAAGAREYYRIIVCHGMGVGYQQEINSWLRGVTLR